MSATARPERGGASSLASPRLAALAARAGRATAVSGDSGETAAAPATEGVCDLCAEPIGPRHGHLVEVRERKLLCACRPCSLLFQEDGAGGGRYRLVPDRVRRLAEFALDEMDWLALRIPVDLAFFFHSTAAGRVVALYPGPMGATESRLSLEHWERMEERNPVLSDMLDDVEALLVDRREDGDPAGWLVPIDVCYELVALFRTHWVGLSGGPEVREAVSDFFEELRRRAD
ncbi:MAG: DUF5947 family protein [Gemmatimonadota bacterium]